MSITLQNNENKMVSLTFIPRKGSMEKYGRLLMLQHRLNEFSLKGSKSKHIDLIKDIVLGIHSLAESWMDYLVAAYYLDATRGKVFKNFREILLTKITFSEKIYILKEISLIENKDLDMLKTINTIRNAFVHGYTLCSNKYLYKKKKITLWGHIEVLVKDFDSFLSKISGKKVNFLSEK